jgi:hypothetical protein
MEMDMPQIDEIRNDLASLRSELGLGRVNPKASSEWSAHANWKSNSVNLKGDFEIRSQLTNVAKTEHLEHAIKDASSARFVEVAKEISALVRE